MQAGPRSDDTSSVIPGKAELDDYRTRLLELEFKLHAQQGFIDALQRVMHAAEHPPADAQVMQLLERSLASVVEATKSEDGALMIKDEEADDLVFVVTGGVARKKELVWKSIPEGMSIARWVAHNERTALVNDVRHDERSHAGIDQRQALKIRSILAAPVVAGERLLGVVEVLNKQQGALYTIGDQARLELMCHFDGELLSKIVGRAEQLQTAKAGSL